MEEHDGQQEPAQWDPPAGHPRSRDRGLAVARRVLAWVALAGLLATCLALLLVNRFASTYRDGLEVARDGAAVGSVSATTAYTLANDLAALVSTTSDSLDQASDLLVEASATTADVGDALGTDLAAAIDGTAGIASGMAGLVEAIERLIPGDSDSLAEDLRDIAVGLEPVPEQLSALGDDLAQVAVDLTDASTTVALGAAQLEDLLVDLTQVRTTLAEVETLTDDITARAEAALDRSVGDVWLLRLLVTVIGLGVAAASLAVRRAIGVMVPRADQR